MTDCTDDEHTADVAATTLKHLNALAGPAAPRGCDLRTVTIQLEMLMRWALDHGQDFDRLGAAWDAGRGGDERRQA